MNTATVDSFRENDDKIDRISFILKICMVYTNFKSYKRRHRWGDTRGGVMTKSDLFKTIFV